MSKSINIIDIVKASTGNDPVLFEDKASYLQAYVASDFNDDNLINKRALVGGGGGGGGGGGSIDVPVITAGTAIPFFVDASLYSGTTADTLVITKTQRVNPATGVPTGQLQRFYDMDVVEDDTNGDGTGTFTGWNIYGHDDGSGNFLYDTYVTLIG